MAQYFTDFGEYTSDVAPTGWTSPFAGDDTFLVVASVVEGVTGGKVLILENGFTTLESTTWSALGVLSGDVEVLAKVRDTNAFSAHPDVVGRSWYNSSGVILHAEPTTNRRYEGGWRFNGDGLTQIRKKDESDTLTTLSSFEAAAPKWSPDTEWSFFRLRREGTTLKYSWWRSGETEPVDWQQTVTDSDFDSGEVGILVAGGSRGVAADFFSVGTDGDSAPSTAPSTSPNTPINLSITDLLATSARLNWEQG